MRAMHTSLTSIRIEPITGVKKLNIATYKTINQEKVPVIRR